MDIFLKPVYYVLCTTIHANMLQGFTKNVGKHSKKQKKSPTVTQEQYEDALMVWI